MEDTPLVFRELQEPSEVAAMLRLRHRTYFEQRRYAAPKPLRIDLTAYDHRSRLLGLFRASELIGGVRLVFRSEQRLALVVRAMRAIVEDVVAEEQTCALPSEGAFDLAKVLGLRRAFVDVEVGRFVVAPALIGPRAVLKMMIATLAVLVQLRARYYVYSCAIAMARRYAIVTKPRWTVEGNEHSGIHADGFVFPTLSCAGVAAAEDSPYLESALGYAAEFAETGSIMLSGAAPDAVPPADKRAEA